MLIKARRKLGGFAALLKPVYYNERVGLQFSEIKGIFSGSLFSRLESEYDFIGINKFKLILVKIHYKYIVNYKRRIWANRIKKLRKYYKKDDLPF